jgi:hypothetical protein
MADMKEFKIGKCYKKTTKDRKWFVSILGFKYGVFQGVCVKESKYEKYITDADIFLEPKDCVEVAREEFEEARDRVINLLKI